LKSVDIFILQKLEETIQFTDQVSFSMAVLTYPSQAKRGSKNGSKPASEHRLCKTCFSLLYLGTEIKMGLSYQ
jgi:hypothetical protein